MNYIKLEPPNYCKGCYFSGWVAPDMPTNINGYKGIWHCYRGSNPSMKCFAWPPRHDVANQPLDSDA